MTKTLVLLLYDFRKKGLSFYFPPKLRHVKPAGAATDVGWILTLLSAVYIIVVLFYCSHSFFHQRVTSRVAGLRLLSGKMFFVTDIKGGTICFLVPSYLFSGVVGWLAGGQGGATYQDHFLKLILEPEEAFFAQGITSVTSRLKPSQTPRHIA